MLSGQSADDIQVLSGGTAQVNSGATVSGGETNGFYSLYGIATSVTVDSGGGIFIQPGGTDVSATINSGGREVVFAGGTAQIDAGATVSGGQNEGIYLLLGTATSMTIDCGGEDDGCRAARSQHDHRLWRG